MIPTPPNPPQTVIIQSGVIPWQVETVPLPASGMPTQVSYTLLKTPQTDALILWCYDGENIADSQFGFFKFTSNPVVFNLPLDWTSLDVLQVAYQGQ